MLSLGAIHTNYSQGANNFKDINTMWSKFAQAFDVLDYQSIAEIHTKDLIRIPGGNQLLDYDNYILTYKIDFEQAKKTKAKRAISFRFFERIHNDSIASEKGVYEVVMGNQTYYGKFHVLLKKENGDWKIFMDYDSNEGGTVGEKDFSEAIAITDLSKFVRQ